MTFARAEEIHADFLARTGDPPEEARTRILTFLVWEEPDEESFAPDVHIVLVSEDFGKELTTAVLWLREHEIDIRCVRLPPYQDGDKSLVPEEINEQHKLVLVCSSLDPESERIIEYLSSDYGVPINAVFFRFFKDGASKFLARSWLIEPNKVEARSSRAITQKSSDPWNGRDFVVNFGDGPERHWEDGRKYGFVSGGQGRWYSSSLRQLFPGARVFANIPQEGFVSVATVRSVAVPVRQFNVTTENGSEKPILAMPLVATEMDRNADDPELSEFLVGIDWLDTRPREQAFRETGMQGNQNTAWKLRDKFTLDKLKTHFELKD